MSGKKPPRYNAEAAERREQRQFEKEQKDIMKQIMEHFAPRGEEAQLARQQGSQEGDEDVNLDTALNYDTEVKGGKDDGAKTTFAEMMEDTEGAAHAEYEQNVSEIAHFLENNWKDAQKMIGSSNERAKEMGQLIADKTDKKYINQFLSPKDQGKSLAQLSTKDRKEVFEKMGSRFGNIGLHGMLEAQKKVWEAQAKGKEHFEQQKSEWIKGAKEMWDKQNTPQLAGRTQSTRSEHLERAGINTEKLRDTFTGRSDKEAYGQMDRGQLKEARMMGERPGAGVNVGGLEKSVKDWGSKIDTHVAKELKSDKLGGLMGKLSSANQAKVRTMAETKLANKAISIATKTLQGKSKQQTGAFRNYGGGKLKQMWKNWKSSKK